MYGFDIDYTNGAYACEEGVTCHDICDHFGCSKEELCACNGGYEPECHYGATIYIPERCYNKEHSAVNYSHKSEETNFSSEDYSQYEKKDGDHCCDPCYGGHGYDYDAGKEHSKVNYSHKSEETDYSSVQASEQEHQDGYAVKVPSYKPHMSYGKY
jgi:hypothetical protein